MPQRILNQQKLMLFLFVLQNTWVFSELVCVCVWGKERIQIASQYFHRYKKTFLSLELFKSVALDQLVYMLIWKTVCMVNNFCNFLTLISFTYRSLYRYSIVSHCNSAYQQYRNMNQILNNRSFAIRFNFKIDHILMKVECNEVIWNYVKEFRKMLF